MKVLVLDDEPFVLKLLQHMLMQVGVSEVTTLGNGHDVLRQLSDPANHPDVIVCDLVMPEMDGIEFVRELVSLRFVGSLILMSGEDERVLQTAEKLVDAHRFGVLGHLRKPFTLVDLERVLDRWTAEGPAPCEPARKTYDADQVREAITRGELINHYQPKVHVATGRFVGVEALVRWQHPVDGLVMPAQFVGLAEEHLLIDDLTRSVLVRALEDTRQWHLAALRVQVAVNVSMDNLSSLSFPDFVAAHVAEATLAPSDLVLEVTESRLMRDPIAPLEILTRLRLKGFQLSIDDFGTGHSSLAQLRDIPFDQLKIDRSFVHRAWTDRTARAMYDASMNVARQMGMEAVAEGVEDLQDWRFVRDSGCDLAQGYFISKPLPATAIPGWVAEWRTREVDLLKA